MRTHLVAATTLFLAGAAALVPTGLGRAQQTSEFPTIPNFMRVSDQVWVGGQPSMEDLSQLKAKGIRAIVNLRHPAEHNAAEEETKAKELGLRYFNIPVNPGDIKDEQVEEFLKITSDRRNLPAFIHCTKGVRVAAFWMIRRVLVDGWKMEDAEAEAQKIGLRNPILLEFARNYIAHHRSGGAPQ
jgi:uncharacterized protein (TIGR01244 family)